MSGDQDDPTTPPGASGGGPHRDAEAYERGRPSYPREAATWLSSDHPCAVLELGAGTGKLTRELLALGHEVDATDPDAAMLRVLEREVPGVETAASSAEEIPSPDRSYDVVVAGQAAHRFDLERALPEIARVLRPGGRLSLVWNERDERIPWVRRLGALLVGPEAERPAAADPLQLIEDSELFGPVDTSSHRFWQVVDRESIQDLVLSHSWIAELGEADRAARLADVLAFYDDYGRGMDGMQLPYRAQCFRTTLRRQVRLQTTQPAEQDAGRGDEAGSRPGGHDDTERAVDDTMPRGLRARHRAGPGGDGPDGSAGSAGSEGPAGRAGPDDDQVLLIDFH